MTPEPAEDAQLELRKYLESIFEGYRDFLRHPAHEHYVRMRNEEADRTRSEIVSIDPIDRVGEIESYKMRGDLRTIESFLTLFQETVASLSDRITTLRDKEKPSNLQQ